MLPLARRLDVSLHSPGVCLPCLGLVADGDAAAERWVVATSWVEGLGVSVEVALQRAVRRGDADADAALDDFRARGCRSTIYREVVRRLADELGAETRRALQAALN